MPISLPRVATFFGRNVTAMEGPDGTWLEPEEFCYPKGGMTRRARCRMPDGSILVVQCGLPMTYSSIDAFARMKKVYYRGVVMVDDDGGFRFHAYPEDKQVRKPKLANQPVSSEVE